MKQNLYEYYQQIRNIRDSINTDRIKLQDNKDFLELIVKNNFLESQNVQLLLNLQLQARTIIDLKNMISKQQKFIEDNDIGATAQGDNIKIFLGDDEDEEDNDNEEIEELVTEENQGDTLLSVNGQAARSSSVSGKYADQPKGNLMAAGALS